MLKDYPLEINSLPVVHRGKVRDIYDAGNGNWLIIASNRLSAFDVILPSPLNGKGELLTEISKFWFNKTQHIIKNHCVELPLEKLLSKQEFELVHKRALGVKKLKALPVEAIVRGYIIGSSWQDYQTSGKICGIQLPAGLSKAEKLPEPIYTPSSKAALGEHDENIDFQATIELIGEPLAQQIKNISLQLYQFAEQYAAQCGIIIADTKLEFGLDENNQLVLMDEILTPDSSRFWDINDYQIGTSPNSFDKQIVRDYLEKLDWNKQPPGPILPDEILHKTLDRYHQVIQLLTNSEKK